LNALPFNDDALIGYHSKEAKLFQMVINQNYDKEQRPPGIENVGEKRTLECKKMAIFEIAFDLDSL
jgi:hypothetical protein